MALALQRVWLEDPSFKASLSYTLRQNNKKELVLRYISLLGNAF